MSITKEAVLERLKTVNGPDFTGDIVSLGMVSEIFIADAKVFFSITVPAARAQEMEPLRAAAERVVKSIPGVAGAMVALTAEKKGGGMEAPVPAAASRPRPAPPSDRRLPLLVQQPTRRRRKPPASAVSPASPRSSPWRPARAVSANPLPRSTSPLASPP